MLRGLDTGAIDFSESSNGVSKHMSRLSMEFFDFPPSIREFSSIQSVSVYTNVHFWSEIALMWFHWLPLQNERKMQTEMNAKCKRKWWFRWLLLRLSNKGRTNVSSAWMAVLKHPAIGAKSRFTKIYENLRKFTKIVRCYRNEIWEKIFCFPKMWEWCAYGSVFRSREFLLILTLQLGRLASDSRLRQPYTD